MVLGTHFLFKSLFVDEATMESVPTDIKLYIDSFNSIVRSMVCGIVWS